MIYSLIKMLICGLLLITGGNIQAQSDDQALDKFIQQVIKSLNDRDTSSSLSLSIEPVSPRMAFFLSKKIANREKHSTDSIKALLTQVIPNYDSLIMKNVIEPMAKNNIRLDSIGYGIEIPIEPTKDLVIHNVRVKTNHTQYQHLMFTVLFFEGKYYWGTHYKSFLNENEGLGQELIESFKSSENEKGELNFSGKMMMAKDKGAPQRIFKYMLSPRGLPDITDQDSTAGKESVSGKSQVMVYLDNKGEQDFGFVNYSFEYTFDQDIVYYRFLDLTHDAGETSYSSLGVLKAIADEQVLKVITEEQHAFLIDSIEEFLLKYTLRLRGSISRHLNH